LCETYSTKWQSTCEEHGRPFQTVALAQLRVSLIPTKGDSNKPYRLQHWL